MLLHRLLTHQVEALALTSLPVSKDVCVVRLAALQVAAIQDPFLGRVGGCFAHRLLTRFAQIALSDLGGADDHTLLTPTLRAKNVDGDWDLDCRMNQRRLRHVKLLF